MEAYSFKHYLDYLKSSDYSRSQSQMLTHRLLSPLIHLTHEAGTGTAEPPISDLRINLLLRGKMEGYADYGFGKFQGTWHTGQFTVAAPDIPTTGRAFGEVEALVIAIQWSAFRPAIEERVGYSIPHLGGNMHRGVHENATISSLMLSLLQENVTGGTWGRLYTEGIALTLIGHLLHLSAYPITEAKPSACGLGARDLKRVLDYLHDHLDEDIGLNDLADYLCLSPSYFCRMFRESMGMPPHQYLLQQRIERAVSLLNHTDHSIAQIAREVGFADQAHFTRHFKRYKKTTPLKYRKRR